MKLLKKIIGLFLIFVSGLLLLVAYGTLLRATIDFIKASTNNELWYLIAFTIIVFILTVILIYTIRFGLKLIKGQTQPEDSIDEIGV